MAEATLEEMAQARARGVEQLEAAQAELAALEPGYRAAQAKVGNLQDALRVIEDGMANAKRAYMVDLALREAGLAELVGPVPRVIPVQSFRGFDRYELVAVGPEGTPLYAYESSDGKRRRHGGKTYARPPRPGDAEAVAAYEAGAEERKRARIARGYHRPGDDRERERLPRPVREGSGNEGIELVHWEDRGAGDFGAGTGSRKPQAPPEGGRWRWLKVREQEQLEG